MKSSTEGSKLMTVEETIRALRLGRTLVNQILRDGTLPSYKIGRRRLIRRQDLERFIQQHRC